MKKTIKLMSVLLILLLLCIVINNNHSKTNQVLKGSFNNNQKEFNTTDALALMYEIDAGSGEYQTSSDTTWPEEGYVFNATLSKCENGGTLSWDEETKRVIVETNTSDKCYVYFDKEPEVVYFADYIKSLYTVDGDNNLYFHDGIGSYSNADQEAGDNSYRYAGANPNNYVCFGSDEETCPEDNLYRIIGVFDEDNDEIYNVKLIKATYANSTLLGTNGEYYNSDLYMWNSNINTLKSMYEGGIIGDEGENTNFGLNNWSTSNLNLINLNTNYYSSFSENWQSKIETHLWHIAGVSGENNTAKIFYINERDDVGPANNPTTYEDEIGLMYPSDYGYAASPNSWNTNLDNYNNLTIIDNNWLYIQISEWTITPISISKSTIYHISVNGKITYGSGNGYYINGTPSLSLTAGLNVRPSFYLTSSTTYVSGSGTSSDPFRIS